MNELVIKITEQELGVTPNSIEEIKGKGKNNLVFKVVANDQPVILRMSNREGTLELYQKEKWCAEVSKNAGVPTPSILKVGICSQYAFSFQEFVEGVGGKDMPDAQDKIWFTLGQYANIIDKIPAPDIEIDYKKMIQDLFAGDYFITRDIFSPELSKKVQDRLEETMVWKFSPMLCHGNLHPSNIIVDSIGVVHLIDWETATGNKTPQSELAEIYTWNTGKENVAHFLKGYGLKENELNGMMRDIQTLVLLRLVHVIIRKMPKNNDWSQDVYIKETAIRLAEISDYEQDILFTKNL